MRLEDFPVFILRTILDGSSNCAIELYKCGNRNLNARLANKGVTEIILTDYDDLSTSRWPHCLREFQLEKLSIDRGTGSLGTTLKLRSELQKLSPTLKHLTIVGKGVSKAFFFVPSNSDQNAVEADEPSDAPPSKRTKLFESDSDENHLEMWNLDATWPQMEHLDIGGIFGEPKSDAVLGSAAFKLLPRSLTWLCLKVRIADGVCQDLSSLPSGLKTLRLGTKLMEEVGLKTLPKSLTKIGSVDLSSLTKLWTYPKFGGFSVGRSESDSQPL